MDRTAVGVIGLGAMGSALAGALLDRGHPVTVWNRTPEKAAALAERGARVAAAPEQAIEAGPLVVACVLDDDALHAAVDPAAAALAGRTLVNFTSASPEQARANGDWARRHGAEHLDGAIMTTPPGVGDKGMMFLYGGSPSAFAEHRAALAALGDPLHLGEDPGLASLYDVALLGLMWSAMSGWLHGAALVGAEKQSAEEFTLLALRWLDTVAGFIRTYAPQVDAGRYPGDDATIDVQIATIGHLLHAAEERGVDTALPALLKEQMERAAARGHGRDSYAGVIEALRKADA
ncbi:NAD(P)-dependent oxidoreductase [Nocardiopsis sp. CNT-189]